MAREANWMLKNLADEDWELPDAPPTLGQPTQVGYYSMDGNFDFKPDLSELKYLYLPVRMDSVRFDLNVGHRNAIKWQVLTTPDMDCILRWILLNRSHLARTNPLRPQFICSRGVLVKVMCAPYEEVTGWIILATRYKGNIYLCRLPTREEIFYHREDTGVGKRMERYGNKFEQYLTSDSPTSQPEDPSVPVDENRAFTCVVRNSVDETPILVSGEIDALRPHVTPQDVQMTGSTKDYVEIKVTRRLHHPRQERTLRLKKLKWWAQSFILGIPSIFCGTRDDDGTVHQVAEIQTEDIPRDAVGVWSGAECQKFLRDFLYLAGRRIVKDDPRVVYKFEWYPRKRVTWEEMADADSDTNRLLPDWYIQGIGA